MQGVSRWVPLVTFVGGAGVKVVVSVGWGVIVDAWWSER